MNANQQAQQQAQQEPAAAAGTTSPSAAQATSPTTDNASGELIFKRAQNVACLTFSLYLNRRSTQFIRCCSTTSPATTATATIYRWKH